MTAAAQIVRVRNVAGTWEVAAALAAELRHGGLVALHGELGAGKTTFVQGLAAALGVGRPITSPTFTLVCEYPLGDRLFVHMDLFRLRSPDDLLSMGFEEYLDSGAIVAVEWPERAEDLLPPGAWHVYLQLTDEAETRRITVQPPATAPAAGPV